MGYLYLYFFIYGHGSVLLWQCRNTLCTFGFINNVIFGPCVGMSVLLQRVTSLRCRGQVNAPAASKLQESIMQEVRGRSLLIRHIHLVTLTFLP